MFSNTVDVHINFRKKLGSDAILTVPERAIVLRNNVTSGKREAVSDKQRFSRYTFLPSSPFCLPRDV